MLDLDAILHDAVADNRVPFIVAMTGNRAGVTWSGAAGQCAPGIMAGPNTVFKIYSMTKAIGSIAAMILIDRGQLTADTPVAEILPEFAKLKVLEGFDGDSPRLREPETVATVRHLATHTSGLAYEVWNPAVAQYRAQTNLPNIMSGSKSALFLPLTFDPGTAWEYGIGTDWLGQVVEAVDGRTIDLFCQQEIFDPLGMTSTAFEIDDELAARLAVVKMRGEEGAFADFEIAPPARPEFYGMGHALYSTAPDYICFLRMCLNKGELNGRRILSEANFERLLANQIGELRVGKLESAVPALSADFELFPGVEKTHSFAFMRVEEDVPGMRAAGAQGWAGLLNTHYWLDLATDVAGLFMTQTLPFADPSFMEAYRRFEKAVYAGLTG